MTDDGVNVRQPKSLSLGNDPTYNWKQWKLQYEFFETATQLTGKSAIIQAATFMAVIGPEVIPIYESFYLSDVEKKNVTTIKAKFEAHFTPKANIPYVRLIFNQMVQEESEPFEEFVTRIKVQAQKCDYDTLTDELVRDKIVVGIRSDHLREKLLAETLLTLQKATDLGRAHEQAFREIKTFRVKTETVEPVVAAFKKYNKKKNNAQQKQCTRCGVQHDGNCPALKSKCHNCSKRRHYSKMCRSTAKKSEPRVRRVGTEGDDESNTSELDELLMYSIETSTSTEDWTEQIICEGRKFSAKLDTGAQCNVLPKYLVDHLQVQIEPTTTKRLVSFSNDRINVLGEVKLNCTISKKPATVTFKVVSEPLAPILGRKTCEELQLIIRIQEIQELDTEDLCDGLGCLKDFEYDIDLVPDAQFEIHPARRIPYAIRDAVKKELDAMVSLGVIRPVTEATPAVSPLVIVKKNGKIRLCLDPVSVNKNICRRYYPLKSVDEVAARVGDSKYFSVIDCKRGFWQIKVSKRTQKYLTFATPWGRYTYLRLPFGLAPAPEVFHEKLTTLLAKVEGVECSMDDVGLKLNKDKCLFNIQSVKFLGHIFTGQGLQIDNSKIQAINQVDTPPTVKQLRFLGMTNYVSKFIPNYAETTAPLRTLLIKSNAWIWNDEQQRAFDLLKKKLTETPVLKYYDVNEPVMLSVDASLKALGAVLLQNNQPVAYAAKALTQTQQDYDQIEKEALAISWACKKFHEYVYGKKLTVESDHKPLESIFKKSINQAPARLQRIMIDLLPYSPAVQYTKGTEIPIADTLSRDSTQHTHTQNEPELEVHLVLSMTENIVDKMVKATAADEELQQIIPFIINGWPETSPKGPASRYFNHRVLFLCDYLSVGYKKIILTSYNSLLQIKYSTSGTPNLRFNKYSSTWLKQKTLCTPSS